MTNFPKERKTKEPKNQEGQEYRRAKKHIMNRKRRRKKMRTTWKHTKCTANLMSTGMYISDTIVKYGSPNSPRQTLYSLAHDSKIVNLPGSAFPIKKATTTRNKTKIRNSIKDMIMSILKLLRGALKIINDTINMRNKNIRIITKMVLKVCTHLLGDHISAKNTKTYWSPKKCKDCDLCKQCGPKPLCPFCNIELIGPIK